jgi:hypothetical protein
MLTFLDLLFLLLFTALRFCVCNGALLSLHVVLSVLFTLFLEKLFLVLERLNVLGLAHLFTLIDVIELALDQGHVELMTAALGPSCKFRFRMLLEGSSSETGTSQLSCISKTLKLLFLHVALVNEGVFFLL